MRLHPLLATFTLLTAFTASRLPAADEPRVLPLWEAGAPGFENRRDEPEVVEKGSITNIHFPTLTVFLRSTRTGTGSIDAAGVAGDQLTTFRSGIPRSTRRHASVPLVRMSSRPSTE